MFSIFSVNTGVIWRLAFSIMIPIIVYLFFVEITFKIQSALLIFQGFYAAISLHRTCFPIEVFFVLFG